jgi:hypothetical protein
MYGAVPGLLSGTSSCAQIFTNTYEIDRQTAQVGWIREQREIRDQNCMSNIYSTHPSRRVLITKQGVGVASWNPSIRTLFDP